MASRRARNGTTVNLDRGRRLSNLEETKPARVVPTPVEVQPKPADEAPVQVKKVDSDPRPAVALFCFETPETTVGQHMANLANALAQRQVRVHLFSRTPFRLNAPGVELHNVGTGPDEGIIEQVQDFGNRAFNAFQRQFPPGTRGAAIGHEWTTAPVLNLVQSLRNLPTVLGLYSLERQRSDMSGELCGQIEEIELQALRQAHRILVHDGATAEVAKYWVPECTERLASVRPMFASQKAAADFDPGVVKARYQVGPIDPTILFVGDFSEAYGPDILMKALPAVFRNNKQARAIFVGDGSLYWTLRVYARYLLLEHAIRLPGSVEGQDMVELVQAADMIVVPSRQPTPWWPILSGWSAERPVVVTHDAAPSLIAHDVDGILIYPNESSVVWGIERILYDPAHAKTIASGGAQKLERRFGWNGQAEQILELTGLLAEQPG